RADSQRADLGELGADVLGEAVREVLVVGAAPEVDQRQHGDGPAVDVLARGSPPEDEGDHRSDEENQRTDDGGAGQPSTEERRAGGAGGRGGGRGPVAGRSGERGPGGAPPPSSPPPIPAATGASAWTWVRAVPSAPRRCSGGMYAGLPTPAPASVPSQPLASA